MSRRDFVARATALVTALWLPKGLIAAVRPRVGSSPVVDEPERALHSLFGGFHVGTQARERGNIGIIRAAIDDGFNFIDNCWDCGHGESDAMGKALREGYRNRVFLTARIDGRVSVSRFIDNSLQRFQTDRIDLLQFHKINSTADLDGLFAPGGGIEAAFAARQAGKLRYIGFTAETPSTCLRVQAAARNHRFIFDSIRIPVRVRAGGSLRRRGLSTHGFTLPSSARSSSGGCFMFKREEASRLECLRYALYNWGEEATVVPLVKIVVMLEHMAL